MSQTETTNAFLLTVSRIPAGRVASYGQIARMAGAPNAARQVGHTLSRLPADTTIPWHRVVNARGAISNPNSERQRRALQLEGIEVTAGRVDLSRYRWQP